ncbi:ABC transporter permease [Nocardia sp. CDC159]|uniref:Transport permease protein n=1 Tax=Nocardia pulmonis TaxID=2951408 RepID=A0A9X2EAU1_9NOCA|nr:MULTISPECIES: ABC transporter permease [Nocardia]MCM6777492.1 ABC transporter permease [Nocardia pulmonis]MCM6790401.1 ABC transporter permease [Nocardia sp. CDC159]
MSIMTDSLVDTRTMLRRNLVHAKRYPGMTGYLVIMPVALLLLFNYVFGGALSKGIGGGKYIDYITPGLLLIVPAMLVVTVAVAIATDMTKGFVNRFRAMPVAHSSFLSGQVIGTMIQGLLGLILTLGVALLIGFRPHANLLEWLAAFGLIVLLLFGLCWLGAGFGMAASSPEAASNTPSIILYLPMLGSGLVPTDTMPNGVRHFAEFQPFTPITETLRGLLMGSEIGNNAIIAIAWSLAFALIGYLWSTSQFRRKANQ